jgi:site-specific DNA recombinase
VGIK